MIISLKKYSFHVHGVWLQGTEWPNQRKVQILKMISRIFSTRISKNLIQILSNAGKIKILTNKFKFLNSGVSLVKCQIATFNCQIKRRIVKEYVFDVYIIPMYIHVLMIDNTLYYAMQENTIILLFSFLGEWLGINKCKDTCQTQLWRTNRSRREGWRRSTQPAIPQWEIIPFLLYSSTYLISRLSWNFANAYFSFQSICLNYLS